jgi:psp operon transcriptional activator
MDIWLIMPYIEENIKKMVDFTNGGFMPVAARMRVDWMDALGDSEAFLAFQEHTARIAGPERPVLVLGERGAGKELAARRIHYLSSRWDSPFVTLLCTALNPNLLEAELFGYEPGAFTGARERRIGYFERADRGTLFLDEVADMPLILQDKLLRVIEYGVFVRVGGSAELHADVRVIAATNRDVRHLSEQGRLRADLLDRLACEVVHVPPLRRRGEDVVLLARHFANRMAIELGMRALPENGIGFSASAMRQLRGHDWPGNVRELKNAIERTLIRTPGVNIESLDLDPFTPPWPLREEVRAEADAAPDSGNASSVCPAPAGAPCPLPAGFSLARGIHELEERAMRAALAQSRHRQTEAARLLGLSYHQFRGLYRKLYGGGPAGRSSA